MLIIKCMHLINLHFWTYLAELALESETTKTPSGFVTHNRSYMKDVFRSFWYLNLSLTGCKMMSNSSGMWSAGCGFWEKDISA